MRRDDHRAPRRVALLTSSLVLFSASAAAATQQDTQEIIVHGVRHSAVATVEPLATLDSDDLAATGVTNMSELLRVIRPLTQSADGSDPIFLLNAQRTSGYQEISALPPEAIDKVEVLPETEALRFGYPPTRRVVNFITKRQFDQIEVKGAVGTTTRGGGANAAANLNVTRLQDDGRFTFALEKRHSASLLQSRRHLLPDPDILFDDIGNVTGLDRGEIDPALSQAAGEIVTVAPVPANQGDRGDLSAFVDEANRPRLFDLGPHRTLVPRNDAWKAEAVIANLIAGSVSGSLNLTAERSTDRADYGPVAATLTVPASNPHSPFSNSVLLHRYLSEVDPQRFLQSTTTLHGGGTVRGALAGWLWDLTAAVDQKSVSSTTDRGIDLSEANSAIASGTNPFVPLDPSLLAERLIDRSRLRTRAMNSKLVASGKPLRLPAGQVTVTGTVEAEHLSANSSTRGANPFDLRLGRTRTEAGASVDIPLTSKREEFLPAIGDLSINGSFYARRISGFGSLRDRTIGLTWTPVKGVQLLLQDGHSAAAPDMEKLASPVVQVENYTVFDFATGRSEVVTVTQGGNPGLLAERRHTRSIGVSLKPFEKRDVAINATFQDADIRNQTGDIYAVSTDIEAIFPDRFVRDAGGRLIAVTFQPTNFYRERQRALKLTLSASGTVGKKRGSVEGGDKGKGDGRAHFYAGAGPVLWFSDRLQLRSGTRELDLLRGDTVKGWGLPRVTSYFYGGIGYGGNGLSIGGWYQGSSRVRSDNPASDLFFSGIFKLNLGAYISVHHFLPKQDWTRHVQLKLDVENVGDAHQHVHDGNGRTPNRFQPDYLDPLGRTVKLTLRKLF